jgi:hypothetical protein
MRLLDAKFKYVPSNSTNITTTWKRFGYRPTTEAERRARQSRAETDSALRNQQSGDPNAARRKPVQARPDASVARLKLAVAE